jgi:DNA repair protein RadC
MRGRQAANPELQLLHDVLGAKVARLVAGAPGGWRTLHESELESLGLTGLSVKAVLSLQTLTSSAWPPLPVGSLASAEEVGSVYTARLGNLRHEVMLAVALDGRNHILEELMLASGGAHGCALTARDVFRPLVRVGACGVILVHNHPSGDPKPSREDIAMTQVVVEAGSILSVPLLDHIIIGARGGGWASLFELGISEPKVNCNGKKGNPLQAVSA